MTRVEVESFYFFSKKQDVVTACYSEIYNTIFYNIIDDIVNEYNNKYHSTIRMTPIEGSKKINEKKIKNIYNFDKITKIGKFKIGDRVRLSLKKYFSEIL